MPDSNLCRNNALQMYYGGSFEKVAEARMDGATHFQAVLESEHHEIHEGSHFFIANHTEVGSGATTSFYVTTPNTTTWTHMTWAFEAQALITVDLYEDGAYGGNGTALTARNSDRNATTASVLTIYNNGTASSLGTLISSYKVGSATAAPQSREIGHVRRDHELILKQNSTYIWVVTSGAASNTISYEGNWYEHVSLD